MDLAIYEQTAPAAFDGAVGVKWRGSLGVEIGVGPDHVRGNGVVNRKS